jgi:hypothetical protein
MKVLAIPFVAIGMVLMYFSEIAAIIYAFVNGQGFWGILGLFIVVDIGLRIVGFVSTMIGAAMMSADGA